MNPLQDGCPCAGCTALRTALRTEIGQDAGLVALYGKKLLYQGWAGKMTAAERAYRLAHSTKAQAASKNARALGERAFAAGRVGRPRMAGRPGAGAMVGNEEVASVER